MRRRADSPFSFQLSSFILHPSTPAPPLSRHTVTNVDNQQLAKARPVTCDGSSRHKPGTNRKSLRLGFAGRIPVHGTFSSIRKESTKLQPSATICNHLQLPVSKLPVLGFACNSVAGGVWPRVTGKNWSWVDRLLLAGTWRGGIRIERGEPRNHVKTNVKFHN
jgi:hypothetical protein